MSSPGHVSLYSKDMRTRSVKSHLTLKVTRLLRQAAIRPAEYGQLKQETKYKCSTVMKTKSSRAHSTTKATPLLPAPRTTLAAYGRTRLPRRRNNNNNKSSELADNC